MSSIPGWSGRGNAQHRRTSRSGSYIPLFDPRNAVAYAHRVKWFSRHRVIVDDLWNAALQHHPIVRRYTAEEQVALRALAERFLRTMQIRWVSGLHPRQSARVSLAMLACLPHGGFALERRIQRCL